LIGCTLKMFKFENDSFPLAGRFHMKTKPIRDHCNKLTVPKKQMLNYNATLISSFLTTALQPLFSMLSNKLFRQSLYDLLVFGETLYIFISCIIPLHFSIVKFIPMNILIKL